MKKLLLILLAVVSLFAACKTDNQREKLLKEITQSEKEIVAKESVTFEENQRLIDLYLAFADEFPQDSLTPEMLFCCASFAAATQQEMYAITLYQRIYDEFPDHAFRPIALLQQARIYDYLGDIEHAKPLYEQFLVMFPNDPDAVGVKEYLEIFGKSEEELELLIQQFENQNKIEE